MENDRLLTVQVIFAEPTRVWRETLQVAPGSTIGQAIALSRFKRDNPNYPHNDLKVGIYGQRCGVGRVLVNGDRVEIYRPLAFDPMESRRRRAIHREAVAKTPDKTQ